MTTCTVLLSLLQFFYQMFHFTTLIKIKLKKKNNFCIERKVNFLLCS